MHKLSILTISLVYLIALSSSSTAGNRAEFEQWMKQETTSFQEYRDKRDKEFTGFLQNQWKEMQTFQGLVRDKTPKPVRLPKAPEQPPTPPVAVKPPHKLPTVTEPTLERPEDRPLAPKPQIKPLTPKVPTIVKVPPIKPVPKPIYVAPAPVVKIPRGNKIQLNFYGQNLVFYIDPKLKVKLNRPINEKAMSHIWSEMSKADFEGLLKQINAQRKPLTLNDWGYALLTNTIAQKVHPNSKNDQSIFTWYLMTKAGYKARIAYDNNYVYLLMPSHQQLFAAPYFTFDKTRYYALSLMA